MELQDIKDYQHLLTDSDKGEIGYDPYLIPPNLEVSRIHELANAIGETRNRDAEERCPCCAQFPIKEMNPCIEKDATSNNLIAFGLGYPLFLKMMAFTIIIMVFPLAITSALHLTRNVLQGECLTQKEKAHKLKTYVRIFNTKWPLIPETNGPIPLRRLQGITPEQPNVFNRALQITTDPVAIIPTSSNADFNPDKELAMVGNEQLDAFMGVFCTSRFLYIDAGCQQYLDAGCSKMETRA